MQTSPNNGLRAGSKSEDIECALDDNPLLLMSMEVSWDHLRIAWSEQGLLHQLEFTKSGRENLL